MKLKISHYHQPRKSEHCGVASFRMVLEYYGYSFSHQKLKKHIPVPKGGVWLADLGRFAISLRLKAEEWHHQSRIVDEKLEQSLRPLPILQRYLKKHKGKRDDKIQIKKDIAFLQAGGKIHFQVPTLSLVEDNLKKGVPVIAAVEGSPFYNDPTIEWSHVVVVYGQDQNNFFIRDPYWEKKLNLYKVPKQRFLYAWYQNHGFTLIVKK